MTNTPIISVSTTVRTYDDPDQVAQAVMNLFPDWQASNMPVSENFPILRESCEVSCDGCAPDTIIEALNQQRILDTALDVMSMHLGEESTWFLLSRQAAIAKKVAFILEGENPVGGTIHVQMISNDMASWIEEVTWHPGRQDVPREIGDDLRMSKDGTVREWFNQKGKPTMNIED